VRPEPGVVRVEQLLPMANVGARLVRELEIPQVMELERLSSEDRLRVGSDRTIQRILVRQVLRAINDRVTRSFLLQYSENSVRTPRLLSTRYCRVGRVRTDDDSRFLGAELILDRVLTPGDTTIVEYELDVGHCADAHFERSFRTGGYQYVLQAQFDPSAIPTRCMSYRRPGPEALHEDVQDAWINQELVAHVARVELEPGLYGMRWEWD
jgi:hypothetical protein